MDSERQTTCQFIDSFPLSHLLLMRTGWYGFIGIGLVAIAIHSLAWAGVYFVAVSIGFGLMVMPAICSHCPYPTEYNSCLFLPPAIMRKFYPYRGPTVSLAGKVGTVLAIVTIIVFPQYWLKENMFLLLLFWILCLPSFVVFPIFYCKRCRHTGCPMNATAQSIQENV